MRVAKINNMTKETHISLELNIDGNGVFTGTSGIGFFDHMLNLLAYHSGMDIHLNADGDLNVDNHHTVEDIGIALGDAFYQAIGDKKGINRYGCFFCPMDDVLSRIVVDVSGRSYFVYDVEIPVERIGGFETETVREFFLAFSGHAGVNLHMACLYGINAHHIVESLFKGVGRALSEAVLQKYGREIPSTKGVL